MTGAEGEIALVGADVSRETKARLAELVALIAKWNTAINLVSKTTIDQIWSRHILDSVQIFSFGQTAGHWADLGAGGGLPGLVVAILAAEKAPHMRITLVESDQRKAVFLRQASQALGLATHVACDRIEALAPLNADVISARALAALPQLCGFAKRHLSEDGMAIFLKGKSFGAELADAKKAWNFILTPHASATDPSAVVLVLKGIAHV